jgi:hypothetical protein
MIWSNLVDKLVTTPLLMMQLIVKVLTLRNQLVEAYRKTHLENQVSLSTCLVVCVFPMMTKFLV